MKTVQPIQSASAVILALLAATATAAAQEHKCSQDHPGRQHRIESVAKRGDVHMVQSIAGHVTSYAIERFGLKELVSQADIDRAFDAKTRKGQMVDFLLFKFGSPAAVMPDFLANGYAHFDGGYSDEAAAILLGIIEFQKAEPDFVMPPWLATQVRSTVKEQTKEAISGFLQSKGVPVIVADVIGEKIGAKVAHKVPVVVSFPKKFDVDNRLVDLAIEGKRKAASAGHAQDSPPAKLPMPLPRPKLPGEVGRKR